MSETSARHLKVTQGVLSIELTDILHRLSLA